uniref:DNA primase/helicase n=2 Tax=unclassified bacterial viruses TaxID=12333 RepID=A0AAU6VXK9_9VIRU
MTSEEIAEKYGIDLYTYGKVACPKCTKKGMDRSGDNLMVYGTDDVGRHKGAHCFGGCGGFDIPSEEWLEENGVVEEKEYSVVGAEFNEEIHASMKEITTTDSKGLRGIRKDTTTAFGVRHEIDTKTGEVAVQYYPCTMEAENDHGFILTGYKKRTLPKTFGGALGETGKECQLFGQFKFMRDRGKYCIIVGGEVDQLSAFQMLGDYQKGRGYDPIPTVSPTIGETGCEKQIVGQYEWFNRFERIIVCMDNDEAGRKATEAVCKALPKGKAYIMEMKHKDPNEYLQAGKEREFIKAFFDAQPYTPSGIVGSGALMKLMKAAAVTPKIPLPPFMHKVQKMMAGGIMLKTITNLGSASGTGKSTIVDECVYHWIFHSPHKPGVLSLESDCAQYGNKMLSRHIGKKLDLIEDDAYKVALLNSEEVEAKAQELFFLPDGSHRWHLVEERDGSIEDIKEKIMQLIVACECKVIIIDPLQDILDGMSNEEQAVFMKWLKGMVKSHDVSFILINHVRKSANGGKQNSAGADLFEEDFQGSSAIFKSAACNLLFTRNKEAENEIERNVTTMKMTKCRWTGNTSPQAGKYFYENATHTLHDLDDYLDRNPHAKAEYEMRGDGEDEPRYTRRDQSESGFRQYEPQY